MENNKQYVKLCLHCGNETLMNEIVTKRKSWNEGYGYYGFDDTILLECPVCKKMTLIQQCYDSSMGCYIDEHGDEVNYYDEIQLYPKQNLSFKKVPDEIKKTYESALKIKNFTPDLSLIALRKTLELICKAQNAIGSNLENKINDLCKKEILSPRLKDISKITKKFGNIGVHEVIDINKKELEYLFDFVMYILEYLYKIPDEINELEKKIDSIKRVENNIK